MRRFQVRDILGIALATLGLIWSCEQAKGQSYCQGGNCARPQVRTIDGRAFVHPTYTVPAQQVRYKETIRYKAKARYRGSYTTAPAYYAPTYVAPQAGFRSVAPTAAVTPSPSFAGGDLSAINAFRARHRLAPLAWDAGLSASATQNNAAQTRRGLGHWILNGAQCAGWGQSYLSPQGAANGWYNSPPHRALMLGNYRVAGVAYGPGSYATLNLK